MAITLRSNSNKVTRVKAGVESSFDITTSGNVIAGDHVYVAVVGWQGNFANGALISGVADDQGGSWSEISRRRITANNHIVALWRGTGASGGAALTASLAYADDGNAGTWSAAIVSAGGMATTGDAHAKATNENANGTTITTDTIATSVADTLVFALAYAVDNGSNSISTPSGWTPLQENEAGEPFSLVYQVLSATAGSLAATWTTGATLITPISIIAAFEGTGDGGGIGSSPHSQLTLGVGV